RRRHDGRPLNRWLRSLPTTGIPAPRSWAAYANDLVAWRRFLHQRGMELIADVADLPDAVAAYPRRPPAPVVGAELAVGVAVQNGLPRYSSPSSMSVTPGRRSSRWTFCQSGTGRGSAGGAAEANSRASSASSSRSSGSGQPA